MGQQTFLYSARQYFRFHSPYGLNGIWSALFVVVKWSTQFVCEWIFIYKIGGRLYIWPVGHSLLKRGLDYL